MGAGPAGSAAAAAAARAGLRVGLCDKHRFPRAKLCGGAVTGRALRAFERAFDQKTPDAPMIRRDRVAFHAFGHWLTTLEDTPPLHMAMRHSLDAALVARALDLGAVDLTGSGFVGLTAQGANLSTGPVTATIVIAADGVNSAVAREVFGKAYDKSQVGFALEVELPGSDISDAVRIDFGAANWGYGWQFPKSHGTTVGVGGVLARNPDIKARMAQYLSSLDHPEAASVKGQFLPFGEVRRIPGHGHILFSGDAAGLVDPITGEGIAYAMESGRLAAESAAQAIRNHAPHRALPHYRKALRPIHRNLAHAKLLRRILFAPWFQNTFVQGMRSSRRLSRDYLRMLDGQLDYGAILAGFIVRAPRRIKFSP